MLGAVAIFWLFDGAGRAAAVGCRTGEGTAGSALAPGESRLAGGGGRKWPLMATAPWGGYSLAVKNLL